MDRLLRTVLSLREVKFRHDDDFIDRLSRQYTTGLLTILAFLVSTRQFVGDPISCWCPAHFTESHRQYTNTICWVSNTYYVPFERRIPDDHDLKAHQPLVSYYQWVPLILLCQALMAFVPCLIWRWLNVRSGMDVSSLLDAASVCHKAAYSEIKDRTVRYLVNQIDRYLMSQRDYRQNCCIRLKQVVARYCFLVGGKRHGNFLTVAYIFIKLLYAVNALGQLFLLDMFLGIEFHLYGIYVMARLFRGEDWSASERFPRVTLCNFQIRHQARLHDYVVQCALTINLFNEKIFILLWFWYVFVALSTFMNLFQWVARSIYWPGQIQYVKRKLRAFDVSHRTKATIGKFAQYYLRRDGIFLIRMLSMNIGEMVAAETLCGLFENYGPERRLISEHPARSRRNVVTSGRGQGAGGTMEVV